MADTEAKKIIGNLWADSGDRTDPDDTTLTPPLVRTDGWGTTFSAVDGDTPRRAVVNQRFRELDGAAEEFLVEGVPEWDTDVNHPVNAVKKRSGVLYRATVANGPSTGNETDPDTVGQTVWETITGTITLPAAPSAPSATSPSSGVLDWSWNCPLDGGNEITSFSFRWRVSGGTQAVVTGLTVATVRVEWSDERVDVRG